MTKPATRENTPRGRDPRATCYIAFCELYVDGSADWNSFCDVPIDTEELAIAFARGEIKAGLKEVYVYEVRPVARITKKGLERL